MYTSDYVYKSNLHANAIHQINKNIGYKKCHLLISIFKYVIDIDILNNFFLYTYYHHSILIFKIFTKKDYIKNFIYTYAFIYIKTSWLIHIENVIYKIHKFGTRKNVKIFIHENIK